MPDSGVRSVTPPNNHSVYSPTPIVWRENEAQWLSKNHPRFLSIRRSVTAPGNRSTYLPTVCRLAGEKSLMSFQKNAADFYRSTDYSIR